MDNVLKKTLYLCFKKVNKKFLKTYFLCINNLLK